MKYGLVFDTLYPFSKGGVERRLWQIAGGLVARGHEVHLFGTKQWRGPDTIDRHGVTLIGIRSSRRMHSRSGRRSIWQGVSFAIHLVRRLWTEEFDVIDVQSISPLSCLATVVVCRLSGTPFVVTWHEVWQSYWWEYLGPVGWLGILVERLVVSLTSVHVAVSQSTAARLRSLGVENVVVVPNAVDIDAMDDVETSQDKADVVYVGRMVPHKRLDLLVDATRILADRGLEPSVVLIGNGPVALEMEKRASGIQGVRFLGGVDSDRQMWSMMKSASAFVSPSIREGFGLASLEALACGTPCIIADHIDNATTEFVVHEVNGFIVEPTAEAFADAISLLLTDDETREVMSENASVSAVEYDLPVLLDSVESLYEELADKPAARGAAR